MTEHDPFPLMAEDGTVLSARRWSIPNPTSTLAIVHGFGEHSGRYDPMAQFMTANGIEVFAIDLRGHGLSEGKRGVIRDYDDFRMDLATLMDFVSAKHSSETIFLYGHSMGGGVVLDHGLDEPDGLDGIIATGPLVALAEPVSAPLMAVGKLMAKVSHRAAMAQPIVGEKISTLPEEQQAYMSDPLNHNKMGFRTALELIATGERLTDKACNWKLPLLVMHAENDQLTDFATARSFCQSAPGAQFIPMPGVEHEVHNDTTRNEVYRYMLDFIQELSS